MKFFEAIVPATGRHSLKGHYFVLMVKRLGEKQEEAGMELEYLW